MTTKTATKMATMDTKKLYEALQKVNSIKPFKQLPVLSNVLVEFANGKTIFTTTDMERAIKVEIDSANSEAFSTLLPRKTSEKFLMGANGKVSITQGTSYTSVTLSRDGIGDLNLTIPQASDFPPLPPMPNNLKWHSIDGKWLCPMLRIVSTACAEEMSRPVLTGIACTDGKMAATDGQRLVVLRDSKLSFGLEGKQAIIPLETIVLVNKLFRKAETLEVAFESKEEISIGTTNVLPNRVHFKSGNILMSSILISGNYPQYESLIPSKFDCKISFSAPLMMQRLNMIDEIAVAEGIIRYIFETSGHGEQVCSLSATTEDEDKYHLSCPIKFEGKEAKISFSHKYMTESIKPFSICTLEITSPSSPGKLTGDIEGLIIVIMPMFVQW